MHNTSQMDSGLASAFESPGTGVYIQQNGSYVLRYMTWWIANIYMLDEWRRDGDPQASLLGGTTLNSRRVANINLWFAAYKQIAIAN